LTEDGLIKEQNAPRDELGVKTINILYNFVVASAGNLVARIVDIKSIVWKISGRYHHEVWVDPSGVGTKWHRYGQRDSNFNSDMA
jgi:hypothetical protein